MENLDSKLTNMNMEVLFEEFKAFLQQSGMNIDEKNGEIMEAFNGYMDIQGQSNQVSLCF